MATKKQEYVVTWSQRMPNGQVKSFEYTVTKTKGVYYCNGEVIEIPVTARITKK